MAHTNSQIIWRPCQRSDDRLWPVDRHAAARLDRLGHRCLACPGYLAPASWIFRHKKAEARLAGASAFSLVGTRRWSRAQNSPAALENSTIPCPAAIWPSSSGIVAEHPLSLVVLHASSQIKTTMGRDGQAVTAVAATYEVVGGTGNLADLQGGGEFTGEITSPTTQTLHDTGWFDRAKRCREYCVALLARRRLRALPGC